MGPVSIKMYDRFRLILRMENAVVHVSFFQHYREVDKDGTDKLNTIFSTGGRKRPPISRLPLLSIRKMSKCSWTSRNHDKPMGQIAKRVADKRLSWHAGGCARITHKP